MSASDNTPTTKLSDSPSLQRNKTSASPKSHCSSSCPSDSAQPTSSHPAAGTSVGVTPKRPTPPENDGGLTRAASHSTTPLLKRQLAPSTAASFSGLTDHGAAQSHSQTPALHHNDTFVDSLCSLGVFQPDLLYIRFQLYDPEDAEDPSGEVDTDTDSAASCRQADRVTTATTSDFQDHSPASVKETASADANWEVEDVRRHRGRRHQRHHSFTGDPEEAGKRATKKQTTLCLLKCFVGTGVLFLPRAFLNGGLLLSISAMIFTFSLNIYNMQKLISCCRPNRQTYGEIAYAACGNLGSVCVNTSIIVSQVGFCAVYGVFVSANIQDLIYSVAGCDLAWKLSLTMFFFAQLIVYAPLSWVRRLKYFAPAMLLADAFIVIGIVTISYHAFEALSGSGWSREVRIIEPKNWAVMLGTTAFLWEGIGLVLPVRSSMRDQDQAKFPRILVCTLTAILVVYISFATFCYITFGDHTNSVILLNLPDSKSVYVIQLMYIAAVILSYPMQLFPAIKIIELATFGPPNYGAVTLRRKWFKNFERFILVSVTLIASFLGASQLDNFVSFVGGCCCLPLAVVYPCLFHLVLSRNGRLDPPLVDSLSIESQKEEIPRNEANSLHSSLLLNDTRPLGSPRDLLKVSIVQKAPENAGMHLEHPKPPLPVTDTVGRSSEQYSSSSLTPEYLHSEQYSSSSSVTGYVSFKDSFLSPGTTSPTESADTTKKVSGGWQYRLGLGGYPPRGDKADDTATANVQPSRGIAGSGGSPQHLAPVRQEPRGVQSFLVFYTSAVGTAVRDKIASVRMFYKSLKKSEILDIGLICCGATVAIFITWQSIASWKPHEIVTRCDAGLVPNVT